ncbi:MAG: hypothetical protein QOD88_3833 [Mycobacterium sp.]|nr:hypothetical protein [Mycobacterium sp.]
MAPSPMRKRLTHLPSGLAASAALLVVGVVVGAVLWGGAGAAGAAAGVLLVAASYTASSVIIAWADSIDPRLVLPAGLMTYTLKFTLFGVLLAVLAGTGWAGLLPMGVGIIAGALGWTTAQAVWTWRAQIPYVEIDGQ